MYKAMTKIAEGLSKTAFGIRRGAMYGALGGAMLGAARKATDPNYEGPGILSSAASGAAFGGLTGGALKHTRVGREAKVGVGRLFRGKSAYPGATPTPAQVPAPPTAPGAAPTRSRRTQNRPGAVTARNVPR
jgi:hypothetical protein